MRLVCPNCDAKYEVPDDAIPEGGRDVQCANCSHAWFQMKPSKAAAVVAPPAPIREPDSVSDTEAAQKPKDPMSAPEVAAQPVAETAASGYGVDESVLAILRDEAEREVSARNAEGRPLEMQADLGIEASMNAAQKRTAMLRAEDTDVAAKPSARRDLLPDVEEINSTLRPSERAEEEDAEAGAGTEAERGRSSFRSGFMMMMVIAVLGLVAYLTAPQLSSQVPALERPLSAYVGFVDMMRLQLDGLMQSATLAINGEG
jgi:predicted Zn finger-like uncharacterized protein